MPNLSESLFQWTLSLGAVRLAAWLARRLGVTPEAQARLAAEEARRRRLARLTNLRCPLCDTEIEDAWTVTPEGRIEARPGCTCPRCDFRLDACRHCQHFVAGGTGGSSYTGWSLQPMVKFGDEDFTRGGCGVYRAYVSVYDLYDPKTADRFAMFAERVRMPKPVADSYHPLPECRAFALAPDRLRHSGAKLDRRWQAWLRWSMKT